MGLFDKFKSLFQPKFAYGPPFVEGQYVTYVLDRGTPPKHFFSIKLLQKGPDGWLALIESKTARVQTKGLMLAREPGTVKGSEPAAFPLGGDFVFGQSDDPADDPLSHTTIALNTLWPRSFGSLREAATKPGSQCQLDCGDFSVHSLRDPWPEFGYVKVHELSEQIPLTCLARTRIEGHDPVTTLTSYGCNNPNTHWPGAHISLLDFDHVIDFEHDGFRLSYPGTWFFTDNLAEQIEGDRPWNRFHFSTHGGNSAAVTLGVCIFEGPPDTVQERMEQEQRAQDELEEGFTRRPGLEDSLSAIIIDDFEDATKLGLKLGRRYLGPDKDRFAELSAFLLTSKSNPDGNALRAHGEKALTAILQSFAFTNPARS